MKLEHDIYVVRSIDFDDSHCDAVIELNPESDIYKGHFPGNPITPGVVMIGIARELLARAIGTQLTLTGVPSVKYMSVLTPEASPCTTYIITYTVADGKVKAKATVKNDTTTFARISLTLDAQ